MIRHAHGRLAASALAACCGAASAQGIPVIDAANLVQTIQQVLHDTTQIQNQIRQITQLQQQLASLNGTRGLGRVHQDGRLTNYVPAQVTQRLDALAAGGYDRLSTTARRLRDERLVYNCADKAGADRTVCQARLAAPYQYKGVLQDALDAAADRLGQIQSLMAEVDQTQDQKSIQEMQARIGAENALLAHEMSRVQMLQGLADSDERIERSRDRERQYEMLGRTGRIADQLP